MIKKLYLAGPLGFSESGRDFLYGKLIPTIKKAGYDVINPWELTPQKELQPIFDMHDGPKKIKALQGIDRTLGLRNEQGILISNGIVACLDGTDVDSGTAAELGFGYAKGKRILGYRNDFRLASENLGVRVNIQVAYFINASRGEIISNLSELPLALKRVFNPPNMKKATKS